MDLKFVDLLVSDLQTSHFKAEKENVIQQKCILTI